MANTYVCPSLSLGDQVDIKGSSAPASNPNPIMNRATLTPAAVVGYRIVRNDAGQFVAWEYEVAHLMSDKVEFLPEASLVQKLVMTRSFTKRM